MTAVTLPVATVTVAIAVLSICLGQPCAATVDIDHNGHQVYMYSLKPITQAINDTAKHHSKLRARRRLGDNGDELARRET